MEHGGKMEHRPFFEIQTCNRLRFEYLTKTKFHTFDKSIYVLTSGALTN